jgi:4-hydroxybenzoate polyprenyltransferase
VHVLLTYIALTLAYSFGIKRLPLVDGFTLATLFTMRLALGVAATQVPPSPWLFVFSMFLFTSFSLAKRYTELDRSKLVRNENIAGRGYRGEDGPLVLTVGIAAGLGAVVIMILYIIEDAFRQSFYGRVIWLWGFPPVVFLLVCRIWLLTTRGEMNDDPVRFMIGDGPCRALLAISIAFFALAWLA